ncbi:MAG: DedA family protein [Meiothermus sp.]
MDLATLVEQVSYLGIFAIVLLETGFLVGFFLPGDTLLITVGLLAAAEKMSLPVSLLALFLGSILGNNLGYYWGRLLGPRLKTRVRPDLYARGQRFFLRFGALAIVFGPFVPVVRTLTPFLSGSLGIPWPRFALLNLIGSILWTQGVTLAAWRVGGFFPHLDRYILLIVAMGVLAGAVPAGLEYLRHRGKAKDSSKSTPPPRGRLP